VANIIIDSELSLDHDQIYQNALQPVDEIELETENELIGGHPGPLNSSVIPRGDSFDYYFAYPYLTEEQERSLANDFLNKGCLKAAHTLVLSHMRYVIKVARGYVGYGLSLNEMVQEGAVGLMKAVKKFNPLHGVRLVSFAVYWIKAEINEYVIKNWHLVKIATTKAQRKLFFNYRKLKKETDYKPLAEQHQHIAHVLDVSVEEVEQMSSRMSEQELQLDQPISGQSKTTLAEMVPSLQENPEELVVNQNNQDYYEHQLPHAFHVLNPREQDIIQTRYYAEDKATLKSLADKYGVSVERVRQLEKNALFKLKEKLQSIDVNGMQ
jgi:RNA polymerase sigma-32 factor